MVSREFDALFSTLRVASYSPPRGLGQASPVAAARGHPVPALAVLGAFRPAPLDALQPICRLV
jgi:hypothetical protein